FDGDSTSLQPANFSAMAFRVVATPSSLTTPPELSITQNLLVLSPRSIPIVSHCILRIDFRFELWSVVLVFTAGLLPSIARVGISRELTSSRAQQPSHPISGGNTRRRPASKRKAGFPAVGRKFGLTQNTVKPGEA